MRNRLLFFFFLSFLALLSVEAADDSYDKVSKANSFAIGGVGEAGIMSPEELAMRDIRDGPHAHDQLRSLLKKGTPAGRMYALFGLRQLDAADYDAVAQPFRSSTERVQRIQGCIISTATTSEVVKWIDQYAKQIHEWEKKEPPNRR